MAISVTAAKKIKDLSAKGFSYRDITSVTGHSPNTIGDVLSGEWDRRHALYEQRRAEKLKDQMFVHAPGGYQRCPSCGCKVKIPCRACKMRGRFSSRD